ncbi:MAG: aspartate--tRNA ligase [Candidatus Omnitrophica bacterium]|nr:aspartate--tRNA ligase [Candidatus Omnitrophota bacterium]MBU4473278.1 aspartate--tRNA ligase [Candidatus Omnitrophota bacterium]MCG2706084.1 aspartate--tRNA ligase [Candidatus Omnitrophota bacterium]
MLRTYTCGQLNAKDIGKKVTLYGWVGSRRDHGKIIFIDVRDRYGISQVVFVPGDSPDAYKKAQELKNEFVIKVSGSVNRRPEGTVNPKLATGEIEILAQDLEILNTSLTPPFEIEDNLNINEEVRLKYRYLDLRRKKVFNNLILRHNIYKIIRAFLDKEGFIESETPILTKSTPEGARDYLVPSRLNPGQFYALPQSPQLFKQILMVAGIDRYYQIAKCFRDEDLRADRQPEFTQLDLEMSFVDEEDIFSLSQLIIQSIFREIKGIDIKIPFPRLSFHEAQDRYGTDKPDLRKELNNEFAFVWIKDFPLFKYNKEEKRWESEHHPFTAPHPEDLENLEKMPDKVKARSYDLVLNGMEIGSGSIRIHNQQLQERVFKVIGIDKAQAQKRFGFLLDAFQFGAPPHGGIAFGLDRLLAIMAGEDSIREVITFPKTQRAFCPLTDAPSEIEERQLKELNLSFKEEGRKK